MVFPVGIIVGIINTVAGGGSLLTLPMLIFLGLPAAIANGTNRLAIAVQNTCAVFGFKSKGVSNFRLSLFMAIPAFFGTVSGAYIAVEIEEALFKKILAIIMLLVLWLILWNPSKNNNSFQYVDDRKNTSSLRKIIIIGIMFFVGLYSGFIQAGVGLILLLVLTLVGGFNLVKSNSHKVFIIGINAFFALIVFALHKKVNWPIGFALAAGNGIGGWIGSTWAVKKGEKFIRAVLIILIVVMAVKLII